MLLTCSPFTLLVGQIRLPQFLLWQQQMGWTFSLCSSPPELWVWLKSGLFADASLPFVCKIQKNAKKKKISKIQSWRVYNDFKLSFLQSQWGGRLFFSEDLKIKELTGLFGRVVADGPTSHTCWPPSMTWVMSPVPSTPSSKNKRTATATHHSSRVSSEPPTFPLWLDFFSRLFSYLEGAFKFLIKTQIFCKWDFF